MSELERQVNQGLIALDEAHRLGRIALGEYRARRRQLLRSLCDTHGVTERHTLKRAALKPQATMHAREEFVPMTQAGNIQSFATPITAVWRLLMALAVAMAIGAVFLYWLSDN